MRRSNSKKSRLLGCRRANRAGAAAVEFAVTAPALILVIFCSCEFARISMMRNLAQSAAYEATRYVIVDGATAAEAQQEANRILNRLGTKNAVITVNGGEEIDMDTTSVTVVVDIPMEDNSFVFPLFYRDKNIHAEMSLRTERYKGYYDGGNTPY